MSNTLTIPRAHQKLRNRELSCTELVQSCLDQIGKRNPGLNAVVFNNGEAALRKAKEIDAKGDFPHPLTGIPYLAKDVFCEKGVPTTACSNMLRGERGGKTYCPPYDSTTTKRINAVGAISLGKTNTDEFTMGSSTETSCYGVTKNPHDPTRVAGGSSGGSAAAVAADMCLFALGTDTGGSIRLPAHYCGCVGMRVTYGRTSRYGVMSMASSLDTIGTLTKTVEDTAIVLETIAGKDPFDTTTGDVPVTQYSKSLTTDIRGLRIGLPKEYFVEGMDPGIEDAVRTAVQALEHRGAKIVEISLPHTKYALAVYYILCPSEVSSNMARYDGIRFGHSVKHVILPVGHSQGDGWSEAQASGKDTKRGVEGLTDYYETVRSEGFGDEVKRRIMLGTYALSAGYYDAYYRKAQKVRTLIKRDFEEAFREVDIIASPVSPTTAFGIGAHKDDPVAMYLEDILAVPQPLAGIPCISVPCGSIRGLPIGLQLMGPQWGEETVLRAAHALFPA
jgi:aspartyl-tRNA(Asn)/glutamyl-tRNA(Gln) amidotransferase subunit A